MKQNLLRTGLMLLAIIVCAGIGRAQDVFDFSTLGYSNGTAMTEEKGANSTLSFTDDGASNKTVFNGGQVRWYQDNSITVAANDAATAVTAVAFEYASDSYAPSGEGKLSVSAGTYDFGTNTWTGNASSVTFTHPGGGQYRVKKITVTVSGDLKTPTTVTFGEEVDGKLFSVTEGKEGEFAAPKATLTPAEAGSVAYSSDNAAVAAVDAATGAVTFGKEFGQATITASFAGNDTYAASEASYTIEYKKDMSAALFYESFDGNDGTGGNDGAWSGNAGSGTAVYDNEGWTAENIYRANKCVKLGTGSKVGAAETPALAGLNGDATLTFKAGAWDSSSEATTLNVTVSGGGQLSQGSVELKKGEWTEYTLTILGGTPETKVKFEAAQAKNNRYFLDEVAIVATGTSTVVVSAPVISGDEEFEGQATVTITAEQGAKVYYTTDGSEPTEQSQEQSQEYTAPFDVTEATTVKAIAVKDGKASQVTTKEFRPIEYMTIAGINDLSKDQAGLNVRFTEAKVTYVDGKDIYLREGGMAVMLYNTALEMPVNAIVSGTVKMDYKNYRSIHELVDNAETTADKLTITPSDIEAEPTEVTIEELLGLEHICDYVVLSRVTITAEQSGDRTNYYAEAGGQKVQLYKGIDVSAYAGDGKEYDITAVFNATYNGAAEIQPIEVTPYVAPGELTAPVIEGQAEFEGQATVTITAEQGAKVYYTTDGSEPTEQSQEHRREGRAHKRRGLKDVHAR